MFENSKEEIRRITRSAGLYDWQVANLLGMSEYQYSRMMRRKVSDEMICKIRKTVMDYMQSQQERTEQHA